MSWPVDVDIGGAFTDVALEHPSSLSTCKVLTDCTAPEAAILNSNANACGMAGIAGIAAPNIEH